MATQGTDYDGNDVASRLSNMNIAENHYASIQQPQPPSHSQSPVNNTSPNVSTPFARGLTYSYAGEQQGYPYYSASAGVDQFGGQMGPPATYPYGAPVQLLSPHLAPVNFDGYSGGGEVYGNQQDRSQSHQQQQVVQANGMTGRQTYRPPHGQTLQQSAQYFGYPDQRQYWMSHQEIFLQQIERKKEVCIMKTV